MNRKAIVVIIGAAAIVASLGWYATRPITVGDVFAKAGVRFPSEEYKFPTKEWALADQCGEWLAFERQCFWWSAPQKEPAK